MRPRLKWKLGDIARRLYQCQHINFGLTPANKVDEGYLVKLCAGFHIKNLGDKASTRIPVNTGIHISVVADDTWVPVLRVTNPKLSNEVIIGKPLTDEYEYLTFYVSPDNNVTRATDNTLHVGEVIGVLSFVNTLIPEQETDSE